MSKNYEEPFVLTTTGDKAARVCPSMHHEGPYTCMATFCSKNENFYLEGYLICPAMLNYCHLAGGWNGPLLNNESVAGRVSKSGNLLEVRVGKDVLILVDKSSENVTVLNKSAAAYYDLCNNTPVDEVANEYVRLHSSTGTDESTLRLSAYEVFKTLIEKGIIVVGQ